MRDLGHDVLWLDILVSTGTRATDESRAQLLFKRFEQYGLRDVCAFLVVEPKAEQDLRTARVYGASKRRLAEFFRTADLLWNFAAGVRPPLLSRFRHRVLVDGDPGHLQVSAQTWDLGLQHHQTFLTSGTKLSDADHDVPLLGVKWHPFVQFVYLPMWAAAPDPGVEAPFTSVTQWTWEELWQGDRVPSVGKRTAYLAYLDLPLVAGHPSWP